VLTAIAFNAFPVSVHADPSAPANTIYKYDQLMEKTKDGITNSDHFEMDFANIREIQGSWIRFKKIPYLGYLQTGHMKEPFSLDRESSINHRTFMDFIFMAVMVSLVRIGGTTPCGVFLPVYGLTMTFGRLKANGGRGRWQDGFPI
jgi:hypothetical protein